MIGKIIAAVIVGFVGAIIAGIVSAFTGRRVAVPQPNLQAGSGRRANTTKSEWLAYVYSILFDSRLFPAIPSPPEWLRIDVGRSIMHFFPLRESSTPRPLSFGTSLPSLTCTCTFPPPPVTKSCVQPCVLKVANSTFAVPTC